MTTQDALAAALNAYTAGLCVVPPREDGTKAPLERWKRYQSERPDETQIRAWYQTEGRRGLGLICGAVSGNLEMLEVEGRAVEAGLHKRFRELAEQAGLGDVLTRINSGYTERTPSGGLHLLYRCTGPVAGNLKLARRQATAEELALNPQDKIKVLIETRGEGGYVITAPSNGGVHPTGMGWVLVAGAFDSIAVVTLEEREALLDLARSFDEMPREESKQPSKAGSDELRPGDDFAARTSWSQILQPHGWEKLFTASDGNQHWRRPGKKLGTSATINERGEGVLYVFSSSTEFHSERAYSKFAAYAILEHGENYSAAAAALREKGYGAKPEAERGRRAEAQKEDEQLKVELVPSPFAAWPKAAAEDAYYGLAGNVVRTVDQHTEGDPIAVLGQFLALFGTAVGIKPYFDVGAIRHTPRIFVGIIGRSAKARKGDSWAPVERLLTDADRWLGARIMGGFGSGEAMVHAVRDERYEEKDGFTKLIDPGVKDKRLLILETELARLLVAVGREGSTISQYIRDAFDGRPLANRVKTSPAQATVHHIGVVGHSTAEELRGRLTDDQVRNGFANRFVWLAVQRSKLLPSPPPFAGPHIQELVEGIEHRLRQAQSVERMYRSDAAEKLWDRWYKEISVDGEGTIGVLTERAEAHVLRLSMIYALTDGSEVILPAHLQAARALWEYSVRSVAYVWGGTTGNVIADRIFEELHFGPMTRWEIANEIFSRNLGSQALEAALQLLKAQGRVAAERVKTAGRGRPAERWRRVD